MIVPPGRPGALTVGNGMVHRVIRHLGIRAEHHRPPELGVRLVMFRWSYVITGMSVGGWCASYSESGLPKWTSWFVTCVE